MLFVGQTSPSPATATLVSTSPPHAPIALVQLSRVFPNGPWNGLCREGAIVLAVNGTPVSSREEALQALSSAQQSQITTLYLLDATAYRQRVGEKLSAADGDNGVTSPSKNRRSRSSFRTM